jgi:integrase
MQQRDAGDITNRSFLDNFAIAKVIVDSFGKNRLVADLAADDFEALRASWVKKGYNLNTLANMVQRTRVLFKYGVDAGLIDKPVKFGSLFKRPKKAKLRALRQKQGKRVFEAEQLKTISDAAELPLKAMILLGINAGFGNHDCGTLPKSALDLKVGWVNFPRPKTAVERRCPLWPETVAALKEAIEQRPDARDPERTDLSSPALEFQRVVVLG